MPNGTSQAPAEPWPRANGPDPLSGLNPPDLRLIRDALDILDPVSRFAQQRRAVLLARVEALIP